MTNVNTINKTVSGFSQYADKDIFDFETNFGAHHYERLKLVVRKAEGTWLHTIDGKKYLDCLAAYSAANQGHCHPKIVQAMVEALTNNYSSVISNVVYTDALAIFLKKLAELVPQLGLRFGENGNKVLPKNGGVESVETAIKTMRYYGHKVKKIEDGQQEIIVFSGNFHSRMITVVSFSPSSKSKEGFGPLTPGFVTCQYGSVDDVKKAINPNTCGILVEPMQGEGGMNIPKDGFLKGLRVLANEHDLFLTFDEIQVGLARTGKMFCFEHENVIPDGIILGKAISGGLVPLSCYVTNKKIMDMVFQPGRDGSTYGGYPLACVAGNAAIDVIIEENLVERSASMGKILLDKIADIGNRSEHVKEVRGKGLFIGIEVKNGDAMHFCRKLLEIGLLANDSHGHTIRISPPLIINDEEIDYIVDKLEKVLIN